MLTFDPPPEQDALAALRESELPDAVEIGENDTYWITISRRTRILTLQPKLPLVAGGVGVVRITLSQMGRYGLTPRQQAAARDALKLGVPFAGLRDNGRAKAAALEQAASKVVPKNGPFNG